MPQANKHRHLPYITLLLETICPGSGPQVYNILLRQDIPIACRWSPRSRSRASSSFGRCRVWAPMPAELSLSCTEVRLYKLGPSSLLFGSWGFPVFHPFLGHGAWVRQAKPCFILLVALYTVFRGPAGGRILCRTLGWLDVLIVFYTPEVVSLLWSPHRSFWDPWKWAALAIYLLGLGFGQLMT